MTTLAAARAIIDHPTTTARAMIAAAEAILEEDGDPLALRDRYLEAMDAANDTRAASLDDIQARVEALLGDVTDPMTLAPLQAILADIDALSGRG
jgi:hypothetical protein